MLERFFGKGYKYENTRQYLRLPASWPIKFVAADAAASQRQLAATRDVSAGGVAVVTRQMIPAGSRLEVEIHVPPLNRSIKATAQVVRCLPARGGGFDLGIRFLNVDPADQAELNAAVEKSASPNQRAGHRKAWWRKIA